MSYHEFYKIMQLDVKVLDAMNGAVIYMWRILTVAIGCYIYIYMYTRKENAGL